jgi:hypothetical protein
LLFLVIKIILIRKMGKKFGFNKSVICELIEMKKTDSVLSERKIVRYHAGCYCLIHYPEY